MSTRADILTVLRRESLTIRELADRLQLTRNAIVLAIQHLTGEGLVAGRPRKEKRAGKPALEYVAVPGREDVASKAYPAFAELLIEVLSEELEAEQLTQLMRRVGRKMTEQLGDNRSPNVAGRLDTAVAFVNRLGAEATVAATEDGLAVQSFSCPLARAVRKQPCVCEAMATFFAEATGAVVRSCCDRTDKLICRFEVTE